ncbi:15465_t:CDS:1, partial [Funneliformis geosporum]
NYTDKNKEEAKERRRLSLEEESDDFLFFMKFTSQKRKQLNQVRLRVEPDSVECLNLISYPIFNQKVKISLADLETTNYQYFYTCSLHSNGCLKPEKFAEIRQVFKGI